MAFGFNVLIELLQEQCRIRERPPNLRRSECMNFQEYQHQIIDPIFERTAKSYKSKGFDVAIKSEPDEQSSIIIDLHEEDLLSGFGLRFIWHSEAPEHVRIIPDAQYRSRFSIQQSEAETWRLIEITEASVESWLKKVSEAARISL